MQDKLDTYIDKIKEYRLKPSFAIICVALILVVIIAIVASRLIMQANNRQPDVVNVNTQDLGTKIPTETEDNLRSQIYGLLSSHFENLPQNSNAIKASVRPDTLQVNSSDGVHNAKFVIDVDDYKQSYNVGVSWSDSIELPNDILIECTPRDISKYPDEPCYGMYYDSTSPYLYLPYEGKTSSGEQFTASYGYQDQNGREFVMIKTQNCDSYSIENEVTTAVRKYLKDRGKLNSSQFGYKVSAAEKCINN